jgi:hypothetical protein
MRRRNQQSTLFNLTIANSILLVLNTVLLISLLSTGGLRVVTTEAAAVTTGEATPATTAATSGMADTSQALTVKHKPGQRRAEPISAPEDTTSTESKTATTIGGVKVQEAPTVAAESHDTEEQAILRAFFAANVQQLRLAVVEAGESPATALPAKADVALAIASADITSDASTTVLHHLREGFARLGLPFQDPIVQ